MKLQIHLQGKLRTLQLEVGEREGSFTGELDGRPVSFEAVPVMPGVVSLILLADDGTRAVFRCIFDHPDAETGERGVSVGSVPFAYQVHDPRSLKTRRNRASNDEGTLLLKASMAGRVVRLLVEKGADIEAQAGVVVIEAMKMQNELRAQRAGRVAELRVAEGEMVAAGQILAVIE